MKNQFTRFKTDTMEMNEAMLYINAQAAHMHSNTVAEEAMRLFDNLMKHEVDLADVESDENVKNIVQLLDAKLEDMGIRTEPQKL